MTLAVEHHTPEHIAEMRAALPQPEPNSGTAQDLLDRREQEHLLACWRCLLAQCTGTPNEDICNVRIQELEAAFPPEAQVAFVTLLSHEFMLLAQFAGFRASQHLAAGDRENFGYLCNIQSERLRMATFSVTDQLRTDMARILKGSDNVVVN